MLKHFIFYNSVYNTFPIVAHFPGIKPRNSSLWSSLIKLNWKFKISLSEATIITWNNKKEGILEKSLNQMGVDYRVLGQEISKWNNVFKIDLTVRALKNVTSKYTIGLDSCDVVMLDDPNKIVERFEEIDCNLLFNSQSYCYPRHYSNGELCDFVKIEDQIGKLHINRYLNAGAWIGKTEFCREFFEKCKEISLTSLGPEIYWKISEQAHIRNVFPLFIDNIKLDYEAKIFQVLEDDQSMLRYVL